MGGVKDVNNSLVGNNENNNLLDEQGTWSLRDLSIISGYGKPTILRCGPIYKQVVYIPLRYLLCE